MCGIHLLQIQQFLYSISSGNLPSSFDSSFSLNINIHCCDTRHTSLFWLPFCRTNIRKFSIPFKLLSFSIFSFPKIIKNTPTLESCRSSCKIQYCDWLDGQNQNKRLNKRKGGLDLKTIEAATLSKWQLLFSLLVLGIKPVTLYLMRAATLQQL